MRYLNAAFLRKPYSPFELHEKVHELLGRRWEEAPMPVLEARPVPEYARARSSSDRDPMFWLKEF
jgi:hypothetical protein